MIDTAKFEQAFLAYTERFRDNPDENVRRNIELKIQHTLMVRKEAAAIAASENWDAADCALAEAIGLAHDFGRFEQFKQYQTFADAKSINHALFGAEMLEKNGILTEFGTEEREILLAAVRMHNLSRLEEIQDARLLRMARLIRDADKLDIMRVIAEYLAGNGKNEAVTMNLAHRPEVSEPVAARLNAHLSPKYEELRTVADFAVTTMSWVYDLNYAYTFQEYRRRNLLEKLHFLVEGIPAGEHLADDAKKFLEQK